MGRIGSALARRCRGGWGMLSEGDITELHIGLKGTMGALYIKDARRTLPQLCDPTHEDRLVERHAPPPIGITAADRPHPHYI